MDFYASLIVIIFASAWLITVHLLALIWVFEKYDMAKAELEPSDVVNREFHKITSRQ